MADVAPWFSAVFHGSQLFSSGEKARNLGKNVKALSEQESGCSRSKTRADLFVDWLTEREDNRKGFQSEALTAGKKVKGRKRHIVTDTQGHLLHVKVHAANEHDTIAGCLVFEEALDKYPSLLGVCADAGYRGTFVDYVQLYLTCLVEIVERLPAGCTLLPKRWVVERTPA
jgi:transposase